MRAACVPCCCRCSYLGTTNRPTSDHHCTEPGGLWATSEPKCLPHGRYSPQHCSHPRMNCIPSFPSADHRAHTAAHCLNDAELGCSASSLPQILGRANTQPVGPCSANGIQGCCSQTYLRDVSMSGLMRASTRARREEEATPGMLTPMPRI